MDLLEEGEKWWLVLIDYYLKFIKMAQIKRLDSRIVINKLEVVIAHFGIPRTMFSVNRQRYLASFS